MEDIQCTEAEVLKLLKNVDISKAQGPDELAPCLLKEGAEQLAPALCKLFKPESNSNAPIMEDIQCTEAEVLKLLKNVDISKAQGPDELAPCLLKEGAEQLAPALCKLFNLSLSSGVLPADWQKANICPLYKKGNKQDPGNYRPISLTSITCKILERIICKRLIEHFNENNILCDNQHGFREKRSCETQLIEAINDWSYNMESGSSVHIAFLDFAKAFDSVPHDLLRTKLEMYGVRSQNLEWIMNFLQNRYQRVVINGECSSWIKVKSGVPQGTILGPILFLCFINDMPNNISSTIRLYADDCILYRPIFNVDDCKILQNDLEVLSKWSETWMLDFNVSKCKTMKMSRKLHDITYNYSLNGQELTNVKSEKYLGLVINDSLNWNDHCTDLYTKCNRIMGIIRRNFVNCPKSILKSLFESLIRSRLEYCCTAWDPYRNTHKERIERIQKRYVRMMCKDWSTSYNVLLQNVKMNLLENRRKYHRLVFYYKIVNNLINVGEVNRCTRANRIGRNDNTFKMHVPYARTDYYMKSFYPQTINEWNQLPQTVVNSQSLNTFKSALVKHLNLDF